MTDPENQEGVMDSEDITKRLARLDKWEERHKRQVERETREKIVVDSHGTAEVKYHPEDEFERLYQLHHRAMKLCLMWESRYLGDMQRDSLDFSAFEYVYVVIDQRLGLRKTLSFRDAKYLPKWVRARIREQIDSIIAALDEIERMTAPNSR